jgi:hypothetical protein
MRLTLAGRASRVQIRHLHLEPLRVSLGVPTLRYGKFVEPDLVSGQDQNLVLKAALP